MSDLIRAVKTFPAFLKAANIHLVETSETMTWEQKKALGDYENIHWHKSIKTLAPGPVILIANEFLDVLPVRQYVKQDGKWRERLVATGDDGELVWVLGDGMMDTALLPDGHNCEPNGAVFEISTPREALVRQYGELVAKNGGAGIFIDYGHAKTGFGDTLQALKNHESVDPLAEPGFADITSHVDFDALQNCLAGLQLQQFEILKQRDFLLDLGLLERAGKLGAGKSAEEQAKITRQAERLALPSQMGDLFKVMAFSTCNDLMPFSQSSIGDQS